ncbi:MAG: hypothetical protein U0797_06270 [Gemmataceae bacterium]
MGSFRRVEGEQAGPAALGILIPPAKRTFVILRPRALPWDAVLCRGPDDLAFADLAHDEASAAAQGLYRALRAGAVVEALGDGRLRVVAGGFALLVCPRLPGQSYAALVCCDGETASARERLAAVVCPAGEQEVYFNTRFFER